jgi:hypothetical protein
MRDPVVLPFQEMMQREVLSWAAGTRAVGPKPALDDRCAAFDRPQLRLEAGRFVTGGMMQLGIAESKS